MVRVVLLVVAACLLVVGCTKHNPDSCCVTDTQCQGLGLDHMYPCGAGEVCNPSGTCIATQCSTSADCMTADAPYCVGQLCVALCAGDDTCVGIDGRPYCADDGACVACKTDAECTTSDAPVCDPSTRACRSCVTDSECPNGACLEADGTCVPESRVVYVTNFGSDTGTCTKSAPCQTFTFGLSKVDTNRNVIQIEGGTFDLGTSTITITRSNVYVDGTDTAVTGGTSSAAPLAVADFVVGVVLSNIQLSTPNTNAITIGSSASARLYKTTINKYVNVNGGSLNGDQSTFYGIACTSGAIGLLKSTMMGGLATTSCQVSAKRSRFERPGININGGVLEFQNNLLLTNDCLNDQMYAQGLVPGSKAMFNTFVCTSTLASDGVALGCDSTLEVTSNIFAYNSMHPMGPNGGTTCIARYSLFDSVAVSSHTAGTGNVVGDVAAFFADKPAKDFHLAVASPARGIAQTGLGVMEDHDGHARPNPAGSTPDVGAFEAP